MSLFLQCLALFCVVADSSSMFVKFARAALKRVVASLSVGRVISLNDSVSWMIGRIVAALF